MKFTVYDITTNKILFQVEGKMVGLSMNIVEGWIQVDVRSAGEVKINVNGKERAWAGDRISYEDLVKMLELNPKVLWTVSYSGRSGRNQFSGTLTPGESCEIREKMVFSVDDTSRA